MSIRDLWDMVKCIIYLQLEIYCRRERENRSVVIFEEIMAKNFPKSTEVITTQI